LIEKYDYNNKCWWCGSDANSREHRFKKSDLVREFGRGPFGIGEVIKTGDDLLKKGSLPIQSPNSNYLKFSCNICQKCNNERSQPFDVAYDKFMNYIMNNEIEIFETRIIKLKLIYGKDWKNQFKNLICYFVKNLSTRFADLNIKIDKSIIDFLNGLSKFITINIKFQIRTDLVEFYKSLYDKNEKCGFLHASGVSGNQSVSLGTYYSLNGTLLVRWFQVYYYYDITTSNNINLNYLEENLKLEERFNVQPEDFRELIINNSGI